ncbi:hypothetical protein AAG570_009334 [Ranatra chinensis]|uniref:2-aminoethanethiol dioxygenase n=1 Tax=Ranatra chinensis TaxID=642074 RepID=A0ABD0Z5V3_9HEMI
MEAIRKQAVLTFSKNGVGSVFEENLKKLHSLMNGLTSAEVNLDHRLLSTAVNAQPHRNYKGAPVTYIEILNDTSVTINMFVLRAGSKLPLHDHPLMYGICKIVHGRVRVRNYSLISDVTATLDRHSNVFAYREPDLVVDERDDAVLLTPEKRNLHEIEAIDGPAAFVDVLAPPYRTPVNGFGPRPCHYYQELDPEDKDSGPVRQLAKTAKAPGYWTDYAPYLGP